MAKLRLWTTGLFLVMVLGFSVNAMAVQDAPAQQLASIGVAMSAQEFVFETGNSGPCVVVDPEILTDTYGLTVEKGEQVKVTNEGNGVISVEAPSSGKSVRIDLSK